MQVDSTNLPSGTYKPTILVNGIYKGESIQTRIQFTVEVRQGASPIESLNVLPTYLFSATELSLNNTYTITAQNLNPNYEPFVDADSDYIKGIKVDTSNSWTYYFQPVNVGNTKVKIMTRFAGAPIGDATEKILRIAYGSAITTGSSMCFDFFSPEGKTIDTLASGDTITYLVRATNGNSIDCNRNGTIIDGAVVYRNGVKMDSTSFTVSGGETITLSASAPGFLSIDKVIVVPLAPVQISYSTPFNDLEIGQPLTLSANPIDATITLNGLPFTSPFTPDKVGIINIVASKQGYRQGILDLSVTPVLEYVTPEIPKNIKLNQQFNFEVNKDVQWSVLYSEQKNGTKTTLLTGTSKSIQFTPNKKGYYEVYIRDKLLNQYKVGSFLNIKLPKYFWIGVIALVVVIFVIKSYNSKSESGGNGGAGFSFDVDGGQQ